MNIMLLLILLLPITIVVFFLWSLVETMTEMAREKDLFGVIVSGSSAFFIAYGLCIFILKIKKPCLMTWLEIHTVNF